ncbi:hypothetical protein BWD12_14805 [Leptospira santarosai serovar Bananal]|nr:hypothetical protein BWD11_17800 [Leptospira santarosai serovar Grippotyphosa]OLY65222.1 hypothetical protein BWD11_04780 [Leptospira santarosai serovar Grippotyphosa]ONF75793.1 hypothetical protein BWD12_19985 [Leptospira santarosai serovar Bananal]ONF77643.1 hypothetical protein BWD12_14805 [Leptospira santarosai serovar Bananal]
MKIELFKKYKGLKPSRLLFVFLIYFVLQLIFGVLGIVPMIYFRNFNPWNHSFDFYNNCK